MLKSIRGILAVSALVLTTLLVSCTSGQIDLLAPEPPKESETLAQEANIPGLKWGDGSNFVVTKLELAQAKKITRDQSEKPFFDTARWSTGRLTFSAFGFTPKGELFGALFDGRSIDRETFELTSSGRIGVTNGKTFEPWEDTASMVKGDGHRQAFAGDSDGENFVWVETESTSLFASNWRIFAKTKERPTPFLLAQSEDVMNVPEMPIVAGDAAPRIHDGLVEWNTADASKQGELLGSAVVSKSLDRGGKINREIGDATNAVSLDGAVAVVRLMKGSPSESAPEGESALASAQDQRKIDLIHDDGNIDELLHVDERNSSGNTLWSIDGSGSTLITSYNRDTLIIDTNNQTAVAIAEPSGMKLAGQKQCGDLATWTYTDGSGEGIGEQYFYDVEKNELKSISEKNLFGKTMCNEDLIAWSVIDDSDPMAYSYWKVMKLDQVIK